MRLSYKQLLLGELVATLNCIYISIIPLRKQSNYGMYRYIQLTVIYHKTNTPKTIRALSKLLFSV